MSRTWWAWARLGAGVAILAALVWRLGTGPFIHGIRTVDGWSLAAAAGIAALTTVACAWRWTIVARGLGVGLPLHTAIAAYYRSQFLNTTLPGGLLGDIHRGVRHGRDAGDLGRGLRAVAWERTAGQAVQAALALVVLLVLPSPVRRWMPIVLAGAIVALAIGVLVGRSLPRTGPSRWARTVRAAGADLRGGLLAARAWPAVLAASALAVVGHIATFFVAARTAGANAPLVQLLPLALIVLVAMGVPTNVGGWGPRESVAAWAFGAAGLGLDRGVATAVVYGVMVLVASLPGAIVLVVAARRGDTGRPPTPQPEPITLTRLPAIAGAGRTPQGAARG